MVYFQRNRQMICCVYTKDLRKDGETTLAPVYMAELL